MTPQELKASILQLAIQGKLVEHYESEEAIVIHASFAGDTSDFFEIPDNWKWLSIKDVASVNTGLSFKKQDQRDSSNGSLRVLRGGNIGDDYKYHLYEDDVYVELEQFQTKYIQLLEGDIITPSVTSIEKICKTGYIDRELPKVTAGGFVYIIRCLDSSIIDPKYLMYFIASAFNKEQCKPNIHKSGQAFYNLKKSGFIEQPICVPPLAEQKCIVEKIEELLPLIDRYEQAWSRLEDFNKRFPVDMQKSILQMAIQGRLVPQLPEEGTGEELFQHIQAEQGQEEDKPKRRGKKASVAVTTEQEPPFDIPETWKWVRLGQLGYTNIGLTYSPKDVCDDGVVVLRSSNIQNGRMDYDDIVRVSCSIPENKMCRIGDILICARNGSKRLVGKAALIDKEGMSFGAFMAVFRSVCNPYILHVINSAYFRNTLLGDTGTTTINQITQDMLKNVLIPLPPLAEQNRIVAKLEEILPLCERLK